MGRPRSRSRSTRDRDPRHAVAGERDLLAELDGDALAARERPIARRIGPTAASHRSGAGVCELRRRGRRARSLTSGAATAMPRCAVRAASSRRPLSPAELVRILAAGATRAVARRAARRRGSLNRSKARVIDAGGLPQRVVRVAADGELPDDVLVRAGDRAQVGERRESAAPSDARPVLREGRRAEVARPSVTHAATRQSRAEPGRQDGRSRRCRNVGVHGHLSCASTSSK